MGHPLPIHNIDNNIFFACIFWNTLQSMIVFHLFPRMILNLEFNLNLNPKQMVINHLQSYVQYHLDVDSFAQCSDDHTFLYHHVTYSWYTWCNCASVWLPMMLIMYFLCLTIVSWVLRILHISLGNLVIKSNKNLWLLSSWHEQLDWTWNVCVSSLST